MLGVCVLRWTWNWLAFYERKQSSGERKQNRIEKSQLIRSFGIKIKAQNSTNRIWAIEWNASRLIKHQEVPYRNSTQLRILHAINDLIIIMRPDGIVRQKKKIEITLRWPHASGTRSNVSNEEKKSQQISLDVRVRSLSLFPLYFSFSFSQALTHIHLPHNQFHFAIRIQMCTYTTLIQLNRKRRQ